MVTVADIRAVALPLPRTYEALIRDRIKFKVGRLVYLSIAPDERSMGFAYPKHARAGLVAAEPAKFFPPGRADERYNWVQAWLAPLEPAELRELVVDAWCLAVPKSVSAGYLDSIG